MEDKISIVTICDNHFAVMLATLLKSIEMTHNSHEGIVVYIVSDNISQRNKQRIVENLNAEVMHLIWLEMEALIPPGWSIPNDNSSFPANVYVRLFIPHFIPQQIRKIIFLDVDIILLQDISELWQTELGEHVVAGVVDRAKTVSNPWGGIPNYIELELAPDTKYFNAGVQIINPQKWRDSDCTNRLIEVGRVNKAHVKFGDQYYLNVLFANQWLELAPKWNWFAFNEGYDAGLIHFVGNKPIYSSYNSNFKTEFFKILSFTEFRNYRQKTELSRKLKKFSNMLRKGLKKLRA